MTDRSRLGCRTAASASARGLVGAPCQGPFRPDCFDYRRAVAWNALAPDLWRRAIIYPRRTPAGRAGLIVRQFGFEGHAATTSRRYPTTFRALRAARRAWTAIRRHGPTVALEREGRVVPPTAWSRWRRGSTPARGYTKTPAAACMAAQVREARRLAHEELNGVA